MNIRSLSLVFCRNVRLFVDQCLSIQQQLQAALQLSLTFLEEEAIPTKRGGTATGMVSSRTSWGPLGSQASQYQSSQTTQVIISLAMLPITMETLVRGVALTKSFPPPPVILFYFIFWMSKKLTEHMHRSGCNLSQDTVCCF